MENKAFRNISTDEYRRGVYTVPHARISKQGVRNEGPVDERDDKRVVGKGWRMVDGTKIEALLFSDGTWGNSEDYAKVPKTKSHRISRPASTISPHSTRAREMTLTFSRPIAAPSSNQQTTTATETSKAETDGNWEAKELVTANMIDESLNVAPVNLLGDLVRTSEESIPTIRKAVVHSDTAVKSLKLESDTSSGYQASNEGGSEVSYVSAHTSATPEQEHPTSEPLRSLNATVNAPTPTGVPQQRGGADRPTRWLNRVKSAITTKKEPRDLSLIVYDSEPETIQHTVTHPAPSEPPCPKLPCINEDAFWPLPAETHPPSTTSNDTRSSSTHTTELKAQAEF